MPASLAGLKQRLAASNGQRDTLPVLDVEGTSMSPIRRRAFLTTSGAAALGALTRWPASAATPDLWSHADAILRRIVPPTFPARTFDITVYGARGDGTFHCSPAIRAAIEACHAAGGGHVVVPNGRFLTGPIVLRSNVDLRLDTGATLLFKRHPAAYLPVVFTRFEGMELMNYSPFVYAFEQTNVAITGNGTLDGQADAEHWWPWKSNANDPSGGRLQRFAMAERGAPVSQRVFGEGGHSVKAAGYGPTSSSRTAARMS
jgi:polygalacturonase